MPEPSSADFERTIEQLKADMAALKNDLNLDLGRVDDIVKKNPKEAIGLAFAAGCVLALMMGRK